MSFWSFVGSTEEIPGTSGSGHTTVVAHLSHRFSPSLSYIVHRHIIIFNSWKHLKDLDFFFFAFFGELLSQELRQEVPRTKAHSEDSNIILYISGY